MQVVQSQRQRVVNESSDGQRPGRAVDDRWFTAEEHFVVVLHRRVLWPGAGRGSDRVVGVGQRCFVSAAVGAMDVATVSATWRRSDRASTPPMPTLRTVTVAVAAPTPTRNWRRLMLLAHRILSSVGRPSALNKSISYIGMNARPHNKNRTANTAVVNTGSTVDWPSEGSRPP